MIRFALSRFLVPICVLLAVPLWAEPAHELMRVSGATSPGVAYTVERQGDSVVLIVEVESFIQDATDIAVIAGVAADRAIMLSTADARVKRGDGRARFEFAVPASRLNDDATGWQRLRTAFTVEWSNGPLGQPRQRERFLHTTSGAPHAPLATSPSDWQPIDLAEIQRESTDRSRRIVLDYEQPIDGKVTIVIEDPEGKRIRNLVSGQSANQGRHRFIWDGLNESGNIAPPGEYRWRALAHPGLQAIHEFDFVNAPGSNHGTFHAAATNGTQVILGTPVSEGGHQVVVLDKEGQMLRGFNAPHGVGLGRIALAADERYIYAAYDGSSWGSKIEKFKPDWKATMEISLVRFEIATGRLADFSRQNRTPKIATYEIGPGSPGARPDRLALRGLALVNGRLYLADAFAELLREIDPTTGETLQTFPLTAPVALASTGDQLYAILDGNQLTHVNLTNGSTRKITTLKGTPTAFAIGEDKRFYVSDAEAEVVRVLSARGRRIKTIGKPGGITPGPYDPQKMQAPAGLAIVDGLVWVTERNRWQPKRFAAYSLRTGKMVHEFFGPTNYGAQGAGFDPADHTRWIGQGTLFDLDFKKHTATPRSILGGESGRRHTFWRQDGRTFIITSDKVTWFQELHDDGTLRPLACLSSAHQFSYWHNWSPPEAFIEAFKRDYPDIKITIGKRGGIQRGQPGHGYGMLWVDRNGDGRLQTEEIEFATTADNLAGSGWSHDFHDLTIRVPATVANQTVLVTLKPDGWWPGGAPKYPSHNDAVRTAVPIELPGSNQVESAVDRFGNTVLNSSPDMRAFAPDGHLLWTYRNQWSNVHGSHKAPLPSTGELQGVLFFSGMVPLDDAADVMMLNGNHGRAFLLTSDGLYIDELFPDVRLMNNPQAGGVGILGGECFGGTFGRSDQNGEYYFQGGGIAYRIYRIDGLREVHRAEGALTVTAEQSAAAERDRLRQVVEQADVKRTEVSFIKTAPVIDGAADDWSDLPGVRWDRKGKFPVVVRAARDHERLYLHYSVHDESPWINNGDDWQALFKTGDGIDLQLGIDPSASPRRTSPVPGDLRLFIAPMGSDNVAVLYRHRLPKAPAEESVIFQSPWRSEKVDSVRQLTNAIIAVRRHANRYEIEASIPLTELGLSDLAGQALSGDFGVIYGDAEGTTNIFRNYWSNQATGLVNDVPGEIMLTPNAWGEINFTPATTKEDSQ